MNFIIGILVIGLLLLNIKLSNRGKKFEWFFEISHFLMGFLIAGFIYTTISTNNLFILFGVMVVGILWEFWEYSATKFYWLNNFIKKLNYNIDRESIKDIYLDLSLDLSGALVFVILKFILS